MFSAAVTILKVCTRSAWHSVDIVNSERASYWTLGLLTVPARKHGTCVVADMMESRVLCGHASVSVCVCVCVCVEGEKEREREGAQRNTYSLWLCGGVRLWRCIIACPLVSSHHKYNRWNWWTVSIDCGHFTSCGIQLCFIMCSRECTLLRGNKIKSKAVPVQCETTVA